MSYKGVIIEESLTDKKVLEKVKIISTKVEPVTEDHETPHLKQWTLHTVEISESNAKTVTEELSKSLQGDALHENWYADFKNDKFHYIVYRGKVFKVDLKNPVLYKQAKEYGISKGIPEYQVDFAPEDKIWER